MNCRQKGYVTCAAMSCRGLTEWAFLVEHLQIRINCIYCSNLTVKLQVRLCECPECPDLSPCLCLEYSVVTLAALASI